MHIFIYLILDECSTISSANSAQQSKGAHSSHEKPCPSQVRISALAWLTQRQCIDDTRPIMMGRCGKCMTRVGALLPY